MPYTPPSQQSPSSTRNTTPAISRNSSYAQDIHTLSPAHARPNPPRSISSTTYLNKHRRSPSAGAVNFATDNTSYIFTGPKDAESVLYNRSLRQSPPPRTDMPIPAGAIMSPPDSSENSDGDDANARVGRKREVEHTWNELEQAVRSMSIKRETSPAKPAARSASSEPTTTMTSPTKLSPEARKISHSRSSTETALPHLTASSTEQTSDDEDDDDHLHAGKPPLLRKKSGELVKPALRPSSRRRYSSMPGTPTYSKSVHFNDDGNQTRHFLQVDKPSAVSAGSSPVETYDSETEFPINGKAKGPTVEWDIKLANFPSPDNHDRKLQPIWVERLFLSADNKSLVGQVAVANISFQKYVVARFTLDYWKTTSEVSAEFSDDVRKQTKPDGFDRFTFSIRLADQAHLETKTLLLCMRYNVGGQEHWDNNRDMNYQIDFIKKQSSRVSYTNPLGARPLNAIPRSRHSPPVSRGRPRAPSIDDDMTTTLDSSYHFGAPDELLGDDTRAAIKLKPKSKRGNMFSNQPSQGLGGRYDFGASLSAALSNAQDKLGKQSGLMTHKAAPPTNSPQGYFPRDTDSPTKTQTAERPELLAVDRPAMGSAQYQDLVSKFCYFTPTASAKLSPQPQLKKAPDSIDGTVEYNEYFQQGSKSPSPNSGNMSPQLDGVSEKGPFMASGSPYTSRSTSPKRKQSSRNLSPVKFATITYERDGFLTNASTPTAIQG